MSIAGRDISVVIPTIPPRRALLARALASIAAAGMIPADILIEDDQDGAGAPATRDAGLRRVRTPWVAFLDDDDELGPRHLELLAGHADATGADYVYAWFDLIRLGQLANDHDPLGHFGKPFDPANPTQTTITVLVRTELAQQVGFSMPDPGGLTPERLHAGEDWQFTLGCLAAGARIAHLPARTWRWHHHGLNTSGMPWRRPA